MLGEAISMLVPQVVGFLTGELPEGATATDLVLTVTQILRETGVVGKFVEYFGHGLDGLLADRATIGNMSPEYGATYGFFPGRRRDTALPHADGPPPGADRARRGLLQGEPALARALPAGHLLPGRRARPVNGRAFARRPAQAAGPHRCTARSAPSSKPCRASASTTETAPTRRWRVVPMATRRPTPSRGTSRCRRVRVTASALVEKPSHGVECTIDGETTTLDHGSVVIAAITSCTNTSNPAVMVAAGLLREEAVERGLTRRPWVKSSLAPGSRVVTEYFDKAGLTPYLEQLGFHTVGYGCTTCIGNSGRCRSPSRGRSPRRVLSRAPCCPAIATSRRGSTPG